MEEFCLALDEELKAKCLSWTGKGEQARSSNIFSMGTLSLL